MENKPKKPINKKKKSEVKEEIVQKDKKITGPLLPPIGGAIGFFIILIIFAVLFLIKPKSAPGTDQVPLTILFSGQIVAPTTKDWLNDRLVLLYERENEIGRAVTARGEFRESKLGVVDGMFIIEIPNSYKFKAEDLKANNVKFDFGESIRETEPVSFIPIPGLYNVLYSWFGEIVEGETASLKIDSKKLEYTILVLSGDVSTLPSEIMAGKTEYRGGKLVVVATGSSPLLATDGVNVGYALEDVVYKTSVDEVVINKITEPLDNCKSDTELETTYTYAQTFVHKYLTEKSVGGNVEISIPAVEWAKIVLELQSKYGFEDNQIDSSTFTQPMKAAPHTYQFYTITWTEIWENGVVNVVKNGQLEQVPFKVKTNLVHSVVSETRACP